MDYLKSTYADTTRSLSFVSSGHITYDLLWTIFEPNALVYTICPRTYKPRCVRYNFGQKSVKTGEKYWSINCCYLDFNGEDLGTVAIELRIPEFHGAKQINTLEAFPFQYHADFTGVRAKLLRYGRKFMDLRVARLCEYNGNAFYKRNGELVEVRIDGRIMVDTAFRKIHPHHFKSTVLDTNDVKDITRCFKISGNVRQPNSVVVEPADMVHENLLICCPTMPGFSFKHDLWGKIPSL